MIADVDQITDLQEYFLFWRKEFNQPETDPDTLLPEFCTTMLLKQLPDGTITKNDEKYYLLSDILPKDRQIRDTLKKKTVEHALATHQFERTDENFKKECLYCRSFPGPTRRDYLEHLFEKHFLHVGKPENLVFIDDLIDSIQDKLNNLICLYCEKVFKDRSTLKEHMRKKGHKRINPDNKKYDKYYLVNYKLDQIEENVVNKKPPNFLPKPRESPEHNSDWSDWTDSEEQEIICLLCSFKQTKFEKLKDHMLETHKFNYDSVFQSLNFYQKVKLVNYIRRKIHLKECFKCDETKENLEQLLSHLQTSNHVEFDQKLFDKPEYFFPTFEDDNLLCYLEENLSENDGLEDQSDDSGAAVVISEDQPNVSVNEAAELLSRENFKL